MERLYCWWNLFSNNDGCTANQELVVTVTPKPRSIYLK
jgi:hypothetical protein